MHEAPHITEMSVVGVSRDEMLKAIREKKAHADGGQHGAVNMASSSGYSCLVKPEMSEQLWEDYERRRAEAGQSKLVSF